MANQCPNCGQFLGKNHVCASVELKGQRYCKKCGKLLIVDKPYKRYMNLCVKCNKANWREIERKERLSLKDKFGGKCNRCGYNKCSRALQFHHKVRVEPYIKARVTVKEVRLYPERFELLCSNCHFELHDEEFKSKKENLD